MNSNNEVSQKKNITSRGVRSADSLNLPRLDWEYLNERIWEYRTAKTWYLETILKLVWSPEKQERLLKTGIFTLDFITKHYPVTRGQVKNILDIAGYSWITARNVILPRLKQLGMVKESNKEIKPCSDFALFFKKLADEWDRVLADNEFRTKDGNT